VRVTSSIIDRVLDERGRPFVSQLADERRESRCEDAEQHDRRYRSADTMPSQLAALLPPTPDGRNAKNRKRDAQRERAQEEAVEIGRASCRERV